ncbi:uncharacterized protein LOC110447205 [Mizuhopecten yessoensis]|uniref:Expansin-YoaJ n=1 Tax=Mizuhopecten yessoensis TaxID=6573 RepID=A0A210QVR1_MIZYE|nr:uncharacterized protein LOC110447205 [Mizuhopecten yessoensis]OWF52840.1 Expansin-YoaJ [Mizuhopecten yessoensis]
MKVLLTILLSVLTLANGSHEHDIINLYKHNFRGDGTYYGVGSSGTCSYTPPDLPPVAKNHAITDYVALNSPQFFGSLACGMCFTVNGTGHGLGNDPINGQHIVFVKDLCPECHAGSVDFAKNGDGRWGISIRAIQCPVGNTPIEYKFQGSNDYYLKLQVRNARIPATKVEMRQQDNHYASFQHTTDGFWTMGAGFDKPVRYPIHLRLTAANGDTVLDTIHMNHIQNEVVLHGSGKQFSLDRNLPH